MCCLESRSDEECKLSSHLQFIHLYTHLHPQFYVVSLVHHDRNFSDNLTRKRLCTKSRVTGAGLGKTDCLERSRCFSWKSRFSQEQYRKQDLRQRSGHVIDSHVIRDLNEADYLCFSFINSEMLFPLMTNKTVFGTEKLKIDR